MVRRPIIYDMDCMCVCGHRLGAHYGYSGCSGQKDPFTPRTAEPCSCETFDLALRPGLYRIPYGLPVSWK